MAFDIFTTQRVSRFGQYDRIDDLIPCKLRGDKRPVFRQFLVDEFHFAFVPQQRRTSEAAIQLVVDLNFIQCVLVIGVKLSLTFSYIGEPELHIHVRGTAIPRRLFLADFC
jgi:hypothetical protein